MHRLLVVLACAGCAPIVPSAEQSVELVDDNTALERGRALFTHNWTPADEWSAAGDGLGPRFNATSCIACHSQGGVGGSGGMHHNVMPAAKNDLNPSLSTALGGLGLRGRGSLNSVFGSGVDSAAIGPRNTTALFGAGLIDAIPDDVIERAALDDTRLKVKGEVARTPEGRVGRFGWKGDVPNLGEFVARACAIELGLEVPGVPQQGERSPGLDLHLEDVEALTEFVASIPRPVHTERSVAARAGERIFSEIGCNECHREKLGDVDGIYSDLLLHDLGPQLADGAGSWGAPSGGPLAQKWRTPPLWGVRDSGPWLHDGRAQSLDDAIAHHGGDAQAVTFAWRALNATDRIALRAFLETLVAPM